MIEVIKKALSHWETEKKYPTGDWAGVEKLHLAIAETVPHAVGIETFNCGGWSLTFPDLGIAINCRCVGYDDYWSLQTTVYEIQSKGGRLYGSAKNPWLRSMQWTLALANQLEACGDDHSKAKEEMVNRIRAIPSFEQSKLKWIPKITETAYQTGLYHKIPKKLYFAINSWSIPDKYIASYNEPSGDREHGLITLATKILNRSPEFAEAVVKHELIHAALGEKPKEKEHGCPFQMLADAIGLDPKYWD